MDALERKKVSVITKYATETFSEADWLILGQITGQLRRITEHNRLMRAMSFGDDDYPHCVAEVLDEIFGNDPNLIPDVINHFDIDLWYEQKNPEKYKRVFVDSTIAVADFWKEGCFRLFLSHLSANKSRMSAMKTAFESWGICAFVAHEDIEPSREWQSEVEAGLETMDAMVAVVEPGFRDSDWCCQEVGYALGRKTDIIPLRAGMDPFGFFGKYQGIQIKGKRPADVADDVTKVLLRKPKHRSKLLPSMTKAFSSLGSEDKISRVVMLDSWSIVTDDQIKGVLERASLSDDERERLQTIISRVKAFAEPQPASYSQGVVDDIPF